MKTITPHSDLQILSEMSQAAGPDYEYGIEFMHQRYYICLMQEDRRAIRILGDGFDDYNDALEALCRILGQPAPSRSPSVYALLILFGCLLGWILGRWIA